MQSTDIYLCFKNSWTTSAQGSTVLNSKKGVTEIEHTLARNEAWITGRRIPD